MGVVLLYEAVSPVLGLDHTRNSDIQTQT